MKFRLTEDMRKKIWLYVIVIAIGISIYFAFDKIDFIIRSLRRVCSLTTPFILGFAIAFLLNKPMELIEVKLLGRLRMKPQHKRSIAAVLAVLLGIIIVCAFLALLLPQLFDSIFSLVKAFPAMWRISRNLHWILLKSMPLIPSRSPITLRIPISSKSLPAL